jgi:UDP-3-O-acyl-N-acetylglucosamine deacetylase
MTVHPSEDGIRFRFGNAVVSASPENVTETTRCTRLGPISTIEHLMSAFAGLEITDAEVELTAHEVPGMDGSSGPFVAGLMEAGLVVTAEAQLPHLYRRVFFKEGDTEIAVAKGTGHWRYAFDTGSRWPGRQVFESRRVADEYPSVISHARTFAFAEEIPTIMQMGLGKGLDESSALILGSDDYQNPARFDDEPARHKMLDIIGDLYLSGVPIRHLNVAAERSGHTANVKTAAMLKLSTLP